MVTNKEPEVIKDEGETITFHLSKQDILFLQRYLQDRGEDPKKWKKAARRFAKEGVFIRIKGYWDAIIV